MNRKGAIETITAGNRRRPGPFGPAWALLPKDQQILNLPAGTAAWDAIDRMTDTGYSQIPVESDDGQIIGVFTWASFTKRVADLRKSPKVNVAELPISQCMEPPRFISPDTYIDTEGDWSEIDYVLVGSPTDLMGILTISDVWGRLNDFAEAFVLLYEIEHELRDLIRDVAGEDLAAMINAITFDPRSRRPSELEEFTFNQYYSLICEKTQNWPCFERVLLAPRDLVVADLSEVNELRNIVFHFRRGITNADCDRLRRFRDDLQFKRAQARVRGALSAVVAT